MIGSVFSRIAATLLCACLRALSKKPLAMSGTPQHFSFDNNCTPVPSALTTRIRSLPNCGWL